MAVTCDAEHKFELCVQLGDYRTAYNLAKDMQVRTVINLFKDMQLRTVINLGMEVQVVT